MLFNSRIIFDRWEKFNEGLQDLCALKMLFVAVYFAAFERQFHIERRRTAYLLKKTVQFETEYYRITLLSGSIMKSLQNREKRNHLHG